MWKAETDGQPGAGRSAGPNVENKVGACMIKAMEAAIPQPTEMAAASAEGLLTSSLNISTLWYAKLQSMNTRISKFPWMEGDVFE